MATIIARGITSDGETTMAMKMLSVLLRSASSTSMAPPRLELCLFRRHLEFFPNPQALIQRYSSTDPKLILAVPASLSHGPSRNLFVNFAAIENNVVLLTSRSEEGTLGRILFNKWNDSQRPDVKWDKGKIGSSIMMDGGIDLVVRFPFDEVVCCFPDHSIDEIQSSTSGC
jgi:Cft2 family RNA processing exonuclease